METYTLKDIFLSPDESFDDEFNNILEYINNPEVDNIIANKQRDSIKILIDNYKKITNKILLLKIYQMNNQINNDDLIITDDPIFESYILNSLLYEKKPISKIVENARISGRLHIP